ncbi:MAG: MBL fold metallo-hydrolase [Oscillospiraceae bacterium]|nr:MBL fold metallo-hydrolase [Oscillospiraceae bacterium]
MAKRKKKFINKLASFAFVLAIFTFVVLANANTQLDLGLPIPEFDGITKTAQNVKENIKEVAAKVDAQVHFIDVGNADCTLIKSGSQVILIDAGENDDEQKVVEYLNRQNVTKIDYLIPTHMHADHIGGMDKVVEKFDVENIIMTRLPQELVPTTATYKSLLQAISDKGIKPIAAKAGQEYELENAKITVLAPSKDYDELNATSVVIKFESGDFSMIVGGDATKITESDILRAGFDLECDIYKVQHHGSSTSNSQKYIDAISADYYYIPVGKDNSYNHPHKEVIKRLEATGKPVYRADKNGDVVFKVKGDNITVKCEKEG